MLFKKEVEHIAKLARLEISEKEKPKFEKELSDILGFVEKLNEVDTAGVAPLTGGTDLKNILRPDEQVNKELEGVSEKLLGHTPDKKEGWVRVRAVFQ